MILITFFKLILWRGLFIQSYQAMPPNVPR